MDIYLINISMFLIKSLWPNSDSGPQLPQLPEYNQHQNCFKFIFVKSLVQLTSYYLYKYLLELRFYYGLILIHKRGLIQNITKLFHLLNNDSFCSYWSSLSSTWCQSLLLKNIPLLRSVTMLQNIFMSYEHHWRWNIPQEPRSYRS